MSKSPIRPPTAWQLALLRFRFRDEPVALKEVDTIASRWVTKNRIDRLAELAREVGIDPTSKGSPMALALALAIKHEPGFQVEGFEKPVGKKGRPRSSKKIDYAQLLIDVWETMEKNQLSSPKAAIARLVETNRARNYGSLSSGRKQGNIQHALEQAYIRGEKELRGLNESDPFTKFALQWIDEALGKTSTPSPSPKRSYFNVTTTMHHDEPPGTKMDGGETWTQLGPVRRKLKSH